MDLLCRGVNLFFFLLFLFVLILGRRILEDKKKYEDCTSAHRVRIRVIQEHKVKYFTKVLV